MATPARLADACSQGQMFTAKTGMLGGLGFTLGRVLCQARQILINSMYFTPLS